MYKARFGELKKERAKIADEIKKHMSAVKKLERRLETIVTEIQYVKALDAYQRTGKPLPMIRKEAPAKKRGGARKKRGAKRGRRGVALPTLIPDVLAAAGKAMTTNELIEALAKAGWKTAAAKPYPVVYNSAAVLVKKGVIKKSGEGKFAAKK